MIIVPCGSRKVWDVDSGRGPTPARDVYIGVPFKINRQYAERFADRWVILSAKYGFIPPDFLILANYDTTFNRKSTKPVEPSLLGDQAQAQSLHEFDLIIGLGGASYASIVRGVFGDNRTVFPFVGLTMGRALQATKAAITAGQPLMVGGWKGRTKFTGSG